MCRLGLQTTGNGPGGLLGQYLGEILASFIGGVGAALAATTILATAILLLTDIRVAEVLDSVAWAGRHVGRTFAWSFGGKPYNGFTRMLRNSMR